MFLNLKEAAMTSNRNLDEGAVLQEVVRLFNGMRFSHDRGGSLFGALAMVELAPA